MKNDPGLLRSWNFLFSLTLIFLAATTIQNAAAQAVGASTAISASHICYGKGNSFLYCGTAGPYINGSNVGIAVTSSPTVALEVSATIRIGDGSETCVSGLAGGLRYKSGTGVQYCNGSSWSNTITAPTATAAATGTSSIGYFVLTHDDFNANSTDLAGAHSRCLTDLTTYTTWNGYSDANTRGLLTSKKVGAFLSYMSPDNPATYGYMPIFLVPSTSYYFANNKAGMGAKGGGYFTTDSDGFGPNDSSDWSANDHFGGSYYYWMGSRLSSATKWQARGVVYTESCNNWATSSSGSSGIVGYSAATNDSRWNNTTNTCDTTRPLICYVNP